MKMCAYSLLLLFPWLADAATLTNKVLILGIDGTMPSALAVARTPNLDALKAQGCFSDRAVTHPVTHSAACWTAMFTGVWGDKNGVNDLNNGFLGTRFDLYPNFMRRLETVNSNWNTVAFTRWSPLSTALAGTDEVTNFGSDPALVTALCQRLTNANPDVFYAILLDVDSAGHSYGWGPTVSNYVRAIETADAQVGQIMSALTNRARFSNENWLLLVLSDHGKHDDAVEISRVTFHLVWGRDAVRGTMWPSPSIVDMCATVLTHMGVPIDPAWNLDARVEGLPLPPSGFGTNLIFNGDAESNTGTNVYLIRDDNQNIDRGIAWWFDAAPITLGHYGTRAIFPTAASPGPTNRGNSFFLGGALPGATGTWSTNILQRIEVTSLAGHIDDPGVDYALSGFLGGAGTNEASALLTVRFLDVGGVQLGTNSIGPVTVADRLSITGLLERSTNGTLPELTRFIEFILSTRSPTPTNDASADNLSFVLTPRTEPPFAVRMARPDGHGWRVEFISRTNRLYWLERSVDLQSWKAVTATNAHDGGQVIFTDTNALTSQAFFRVGCGRLAP